MTNKTILILLLVQLCLFFANSQYPTYNDYCIMFNKSYTEQQKIIHQQIYESNVQKMKNIHEYRTGVNQFTDQLQSSIPRGIIQQDNGQKVSSSVIKPYLGAPTQFDWRDNNVVTSIKNQASCGACWAFAAVAAAQSLLIIKGEYEVDNIDLSQQYLLKCTTDSNCGGGYLSHAMSTARRIPFQSQYPYQPSQSTLDSDICFATGVDVALTFSSYYDLTDQQIITLLQSSPLAISIASSNWSFYNGGIFSCGQNDGVDHAVLLVGYTESYWIVKNQWGQTWGDNGYIWINRDRIGNKNCRIGRGVYQLYQKNSFFTILGVMSAIILMALI